ncbi:MAG: hypothetical protein WBQ94_13565 [Terracidiphilus sp.]
MSETGKSRFTRRQFCTDAAALGSLGMLTGKLGAWAVEMPVMIGTNGAESLRAHATARGLLYGTAVMPQLLDVDGFAAGKTTDPYTQLIATQANSWWRRPP